MTQETKNKRLAILLVALLITVVGVSWYSNRDKSNKPQKDLFSALELQDVDRVLLERNGEKVDLTFNGARWKVNETFDADRDMVKVLFATLKQAEPKRPVASALLDSVRHRLNEAGTTVTLYQKGSNVLRFQVAGNARQTQTFFKKTEEEIPYLMTIPGYRVYVGGIFELDESGWRDKFVFNFNWRNFHSLTVKPAKAKEFVVTLSDGMVNVDGLQKLDTAKMNTFMENVSLLTVDRYLSRNTLLDSLAATLPVMEFVVTDIAKKEISVKLFPATPQSYHGLINNAQWADFQAEKIRPTLRHKEFFAQP